VLVIPNVGFGFTIRNTRKGLITLLLTGSEKKEQYNGGQKESKQFHSKWI
jgi:hypothetical protein